MGCFLSALDSMEKHLNNHALQSVLAI